MESHLDVNNQENIRPGTVTEKPFPSIKQALGLLGILVLIMFIVIIFLSIVKNYISYDMKPLMNAAAYIISVGSLLFIGIFQRKNSKFLLKRVSWKVLLLIIPLVFSLGILLEPLIDAIPMPEVVKKAFEELFSKDIYSFLTIVIAAPILEELIFRGIILDGFLKRYSPVKAIIWSSIFFGIAHLNPWQFIAAFGIGVLIGWLYWKSKSLIPCIAAHFFNNLFGFLMLIYSGDSMMTTRQFMGDDNKLYYVLYGMCILLFVGSFMMIRKRLNPKIITNTHPNS